MRKKVIKQVEEEIVNIPNFLTLSRVILTLVLIYMFFFDYSVAALLFVFVVAAFTDFLDGQIARGFGLTTKFGAKFDMIADRFLWVSFGIGVLIFFPIRGVFDNYHVVQMLIIFSREILSFPFFLVNLLRGGVTTPVVHGWVGKTTTFLQAFAIPFLILSVYYAEFSFTIVLSIITGIVGVWAFFDYISEIKFFK